MKRCAAVPYTMLHSGWGPAAHTTMLQGWCPMARCEMRAPSALLLPVQYQHLRIKQHILQHVYDTPSHQWHASGQVVAVYAVLDDGRAGTAAICQHTSLHCSMHKAGTRLASMVFSVHTCNVLCIIATGAAAGAVHVTACLSLAVLCVRDTSAAETLQKGYACAEGRASGTWARADDAIDSTTNVHGPAVGSVLPVHRVTSGRRAGRAGIFTKVRHAQPRQYRHGLTCW